MQGRCIDHCSGFIAQDRCIDHCSGSIAQDRCIDRRPGSIALGRGIVSPPPVQALVLDLGGVVVDWDPRHLYRKLFAGDEAAMEHFLAHVCTGAWNEAQDAGRPFAAAIAERQARFPDYRDPIAAFWDRWDEMLAGPIPGAPELRIRGGVQFRFRGHGSIQGL